MRTRCSTRRSKTRVATQTTTGLSLSADRRAAIARAVEQERSRIELDETQTTEPLTELGRDVKNHTDMPTVLIDRMVRQGATKTLKNFKGRGKPS